MTKAPLKILTVCTLLAGLSLTGCGYAEGGKGMSLDEATYVSYAYQPKTITLTDIRTGEIFWEYELPVGKQLTLRFYENKAPDNVYTPDRMNWEVFDKKTGHGQLRNTMLVPPSSARRLEFTIRDTPEFPPSENG